jgi:hypothetical protein
MKKVLLVFAVFAVLLIAVNSSEASGVTYFPNGDTSVYLDQFSINLGGDHAVVTFNKDGTVTGSILDPQGYVYFDLYMDIYGYLYCSSDGINFYSCN